MKTEVYQLTNQNVTLTSYVLDSSPEMPYRLPRPALLLCPGGAYRMCSDREGEPIAMHFLAMGLNVFILRYSLNENAKYPQPLSDAEEAFSFIVSHKDELQIDPAKIAVCGFSAGGHLAAALSTMGKVRPAAMILGYPCITEKICTEPILPFPVPTLDDKVDDKTPSAFIFGASDDTCVPIDNTFDFANALVRRGISVEVHVFEKGEHGFATGDYVTNSCYNENDDFQWLSLCRKWLNKKFFEVSV